MDYEIIATEFDEKLLNWYKNQVIPPWTFYSVQHIHAKLGLYFTLIQPNDVGFLNARYRFEIIDKKLFMLARLKYGI